MTPEERTEKLDALRRYETTRREQLGAVVNLNFGLATAAAGFCVSHMIDKDAQFSRPGSCYFLAATLVFVLTICLCMLTIWTRLRDFRLTAKKLRDELRGADAKEIQDLKDICDRLGNRTWFLLCAQFITFAIAVVLLGLALWLLYHNHVLPNSGNP